MAWMLKALFVLKIFKALSRRLGYVGKRHDFWRKSFLKLYSINWPSFKFAWLLLVLEMLGNICIVIICFPVCEVMNFEINLSILIKPFSYMTKKSGPKIEAS